MVSNMLLIWAPVMLRAEVNTYMSIQQCLIWLLTCQHFFVLSMIMSAEGLILVTFDFGPIFTEWATVMLGLC